MVTVLLAQNTQINHANLAAHITPFNDLLQNPAIKPFWDPATPAGAMALNDEITRQASMIGYINDFKLMMLVTLISLPLVFLLSSPRRAAKSSEAVVMD